MAEEEPVEQVNIIYCIRAGEGSGTARPTGSLAMVGEFRAELYNCRVLSREQITELASMVVRESPDVVTHARGLFRL